MFQGKTYQFNFLPFSLSSASWVFKKTLKLALAILLLRERGVQLIAYIDDLLLLAESKDLILDQVTGVRHLLECLGFIVNIKKSILDPAQVIEFLGLSVDSLAMEIRLPLVKFKQKLTSWQNRKDSSPNVSTTTRQDKCHELCPSTWTPVLLPSVDGTDQHIGAELPIL